MKHTVVFAQQGIYAGWPANHGSWQWGDEFLVGFLQGAYGKSSMHNVHGPLTKKLARSLDGGETWRVEDPNVDFEALFSSPAPEFSLDRAIIRVCGNYDHGGDDCPPGGGFYLSSDKGLTWSGAFSFNGLEDEFSKDIGSESIMNTARTCVLGDLVFLSSREQRSWGSDKTICCVHDGRRFTKIGEIDDPKGRVVMPAAAKVGSRIVVAARRRGGYRRECWIDSFCSDDGGRTWKDQGRISDTGGSNGNPPALIEIDGKLVCAFANRSDKQMQYSVSEDGGDSWSPPVVLRVSHNSDIGYPRLFKRSDGQIVCVYYWADNRDQHQRIAASIFKI